LGSCAIQGVHEKKNCGEKKFVRQFVPIIRLLKVSRKFTLTVLIVNMAAYSREQRILCGERIFLKCEIGVEVQRIIDTLKSTL
jgi:hypothetical protein